MNNVLNGEAKTPEAEIIKRISTLQEHLEDNAVDGALIIQKSDLFYFSGTVQDGHLYVPVQGKPLLMVYKHVNRAESESGIEIVLPLNSPEAIPGILKDHGHTNPAVLGLELDVLPANLYLNYRRIFQNSVLQDISPSVRLIRAVKSPYEITLIRRSAQLADQVSRSVTEFICEGITEIELAGKVEAYARKLGHQGIVRMRLWGSELFYGHLMAGPSAAVPSYLSSPTGGIGINPAVAQGAGSRPIRRNEPVLVDYVFAQNGYLADHARIFVLGKLPEHLEKGHRLMLKLQDKIKKAAKPPIKAGDIYDMAVDFVHRFGYGDYFMGADPQRIRFIGHGLGLELDEFPFLAKGQMLPLQPGMTLALEPKLVFPGEGVVGIENTHLVTENGLEQLTCYEEDIIAL
ncbi:MAG: peptidase M24 [Deltaproteobacteria bacterium RBG_13_49_15]|nr:MAG: peptidase M24 [Deltaproteobacteria bacterium RBG_13_49_15]